MEQILEVEAMVLQISSMADKLFRGLEELMAGRLSFDLIHDEEVRREFRELRSAALNKGYEVVFPSPSQVFQLPTSFLAENGNVQVVVDIPIVPIRHYNNFDLYHYHSVPFLLGNQLVRVRSTDSVLPVNKDKSQFMERDACIWVKLFCADTQVSFVRGRLSVVFVPSSRGMLMPF